MNHVTGMVNIRLTLEGVVCYVMTEVNGSHRPHWLRKRTAESESNRASKPILVRYIPKNDGRIVAPAEVMKLSSITNERTAVMKYDTKLIDLLNNVVNSARAFELE